MHVLKLRTEVQRVDTPLGYERGPLSCGFDWIVEDYPTLCLEPTRRTDLSDRAFERVAWNATTSPFSTVSEPLKGTADQQLWPGLPCMNT